MAKLHFYYAAMNAGKSTILLQSAYNYEERGMAVLTFTPLIDDRAEVGLIASRIGLSRSAIAFQNDDDLLQMVFDRAWDPQASAVQSPALKSPALQSPAISCVLVDEAQFLSPAQVLQLTIVVDQLGIPVICYGLRTDFQGEPFPGSKYLLAWADDIHEIKTVCHTGKKATMNARIGAEGQRVRSGNQIDIGHHYVALSRSQFELANISPIGYQIPADIAAALQSSPRAKPS